MKGRARGRPEHQVSAAASCRASAAFNEALGLIAKGRIGKNFAPFGTQPGKNDLCLDIPVGIKLTHPEEAGKGTTDLNRGGPPDNQPVLLAQ
jgi:hypothetical protein